MTSVAIIATPDDGSCGIGTYTGSLRSEFPERIDHAHHEIAVGSLNPLGYIRAAIDASTSDADIVHVQHEYGIFGPKSILSWIFFPVLYLACIITQKRIIITLHNAWNAETITPPLATVKKIYVAVNNRMLATVGDELLFLSDNCKSTFTESTNVGDCEVLPHGVQTNEVTGTDSSDAKELFDYSTDDTVIVEPGFVRPEKGSDVFVEIARDIPELEFLLAGGVPDGFEGYDDELMNGAPENVKCTGRLSDERFHAAFEAADLLVLPYREVSQSGIFNFAAAYEVPVVASREDYFERLNEEWGCVKLFDVSKTEEAASAINTVLTDQEEREGLLDGLKAYKTGKTMGVVAEKHVELYRDE